MFYGMDRAMKTTIEVSDALYRRAKSEAALRGRKVKDLVEEGLRLVLETPRRSRRRRSLAELMRNARGTVDSGITGSRIQSQTPQGLRPQCAAPSLIRDH